VAATIGCDRPDLLEDVWSAVAQWLFYSLGKAERQPSWSDVDDETREPDDPSHLGGPSLDEPDPDGRVIVSTLATLSLLAFGVCVSDAHPAGAGSRPVVAGCAPRPQAHDHSPVSEEPPPRAALWWDPEGERLEWLIRRTCLGQIGPHFLSHAFMYSPVADALVDQRLAVRGRRAVRTIACCPACQHHHTVLEERRSPICDCPSCRLVEHYVLKAERWLSWQSGWLAQFPRPVCATCGRIVVPRHGGEGWDARVITLDRNPQHGPECPDGHGPTRMAYVYQAAHGIVSTSALMPVADPDAALEGDARVDGEEEAVEQGRDERPGVRVECVRRFLNATIREIKDRLTAERRVAEARATLLVVLYALPILQTDPPSLPYGWELEFIDALVGRTGPVLDALHLAMGRVRALGTTVAAPPTTSMFKTRKCYLKSVWQDFSTNG
jgi:hypothetical protein